MENEKGEIEEEKNEQKEENGEKQHYEKDDFQELKKPQNGF